MSTTVANGNEQVVKPDHAAARKHMIFTDEHDDLLGSVGDGAGHCCSSVVGSWRVPSGSQKVDSTTYYFLL